MSLEPAEQLLRMLSYLATPFVAAGAAAIAYQQYKVNHNKLRLDGYKRRLRIYHELRKILGIITSNGTATDRQLVEFRMSVDEAGFLFGAEVMAYLEEFYRHAVELARWRSEFRDLTQAPHPPEYNHAKVVANAQREMGWLTTQYEPARTLFRKHLDISS
jgi:hypothetical protein